MDHSNLHTHTTFSDGAHTMEENIRSAIDQGMVSLGFSDHSYTPCDPLYCMQKERYAEYLEQLSALKQKYADRLPVYAGLELDAYSDDDCSAFDYTIASVHYLIRDGVCHPIDHSPQQQERCIREAFGGDVLAMAQAYFDLLCHHVEQTKPTLVGHFDLITKFSMMPEEDPAYRAMAKSALERILKTCAYVEMNTGAIARGWRETPYPAPYLLTILRDLDGRIVINSDSHDKACLTCWFPQALELLKKNGITHVWQFNGTAFDPKPL